MYLIRIRQEVAFAGEEIGLQEVHRCDKLVIILYGWAHDPAAKHSHNKERPAPESKRVNEAVHVNVDI